LFQDLAILVKLQGELIDNIEMNIKSAKAAVFEGEKNIVQAKKNMQSARKVGMLLFRKNVVFL
jgi:t-SNARE complex subunit (syntaxin)